MSSSRHAWLAAHPYLEGIARFQATVEDAVAQGPPCRFGEPTWESYAADEAVGVPLLRSESAGVDLAPAADALAHLAARMASALRTTPLGRGCRELSGELERSRDAPRQALGRLVSAGEAERGLANAGLLSFLGWNVVRHALAPIAGRARWRDEERWGRAFCPACGALPLSSQLASTDGGARARFFACGRCATRWRYRRTGCPFCGADGPERLAILQVEGAEGLRLDVCNQCSGYVKTYTGEGDEELFLADWPTLHLDVLALERGFRRLGASLYELPMDERRTS